MGLRALPTICNELIKHGLPADKPAALIQKATTSEQQVLVGTLTTLPTLVAQAEVTSQSLIIIGDVVKLQQKLAWFNPH